MTRHNMAWGLLHGGSITTRDWIRGSSEKPGIDGRDARVMKILSDKDDSIRGWYTEAFLKAALASPYGKNILRMDDVNTYDTPLEGPHFALQCSETGIFVDRPSLKNTATYRREVKYVITKIDTGTYNIAWEASDGTSGNKIVSGVVGAVKIPFYDGYVHLNGIHTAATLPSFKVTYRFLPLVNPTEELAKRMGVDILNDPAGELVEDILWRHLQ